jgi:hypothetical protein
MPPKTFFLTFLVLSESGALEKSAGMGVAQVALHKSKKVGERRITLVNAAH